MIGKIKENKAFKLIYNVLYTALVILTLLILITVILQRVSNNTIALGGIRIFNVATGSMIPKYNVGDILISKTIDSSKIKVGDDVVYEGKKADFAGKIVTHQVIEIEEENGEYKFHTKGIANDEEDPIVEQSQILGKIIYKTTILSYISKLVNNLYSFYFIIFIPMVILIFIEVRNIVANWGEQEEDTEDNAGEKNEEENNEENK